MQICHHYTIPMMKVLTLHGMIQIDFQKRDYACVRVTILCMCTSPPYLVKTFGNTYTIYTKIVNKICSRVYEDACHYS